MPVKTMASRCLKWKEKEEETEKRGGRTVISKEVTTHDVKMVLGSCQHICKIY